ncbi:MAG: toprim domain-containing protein [Chloroflexi bacterium]|nr:toprim domain-containing protein [Chloroflexota bacterium]
MSDGQALPLKKAPAQQPTPEKDWNGKHKRLEAIWKGTVPDNGRIAEYLQYRGLDIQVPPTLRLHPALPYFHQGPPVKFPCMVAQIIRGDDLVGLHRTWLDPNGPGKAPISKPKKTWKCVESMSGGVIQLFPLEPGQPIILTEGIESGLAVRQLTGYPVWACVNSTMLGKAEIPDDSTEIFVGADKDKSGAGERAARKLGERLWETGRVIKISLPPTKIPDGAKSFDWADYVAQGQEVACG